MVSLQLVDALLQACYLLAQLFYLVLQVLLSTAHAGVAGLESVTEAASRSDSVIFPTRYI